MTQMWASFGIVAIHRFVGSLALAASHAVPEIVFSTDGARMPGLAPFPCTVLLLSFSFPTRV